MAVTASGVAVGTSAAPLAAVPPGPCQVVVSFTSSTAGAVMYVGTRPAGAPSPSVTTSDGFPVPAGAQPVTVVNMAGSPPAQLDAVGSAAGTAGVLISTPR
jgi:hypothetical protein